MEYFAIQGGLPLEGSLSIHGAKNSALPILAATLLAKGECVLHNCPPLTDISAAMAILRSLGCQVRREEDTVIVNPASFCGGAVPEALMGEMRASVLFLGALLARSGEAAVSCPGGCALGARPIDLHLRAMRLLGASILENGTQLICRSRKLRGQILQLPFPSVGATENAMLAACGARGTTEIRNAAREPEIVDLQNFLRTLGAEVCGAGTDRIVIEGGRPLSGGEYTIMPDRIVTATCLCAVAAAGGEAELYGGQAETVRPVISALTAAGCEIESHPERLCLRRRGTLRGVGTVMTAPYPGFPTDAQPLLAAALAGGTGESRIIETIFEHRFHYATQLARMGASIRIEGNTLEVTGTGGLHGAVVTAGDLRGGAALTIAALAAKGDSRVFGLSYIDRGYLHLEQSLAALGGKIRRVTE